MCTSGSWERHIHSKQPRIQRRELPGCYQSSPLRALTRSRLPYRVQVGGKKARERITEEWRAKSGVIASVASLICEDHFIIWAVETKGNWEPRAYMHMHNTRIWFTVLIKDTVCTRLGRTTKRRAAHLFRPMQIYFLRQRIFRTPILNNLLSRVRNRDCCGIQKGTWQCPRGRIRKDTETKPKRPVHCSAVAFLGQRWTNSATKQSYM